MEALISRINEIRCQHKEARKRIREFINMQKCGNEDWFSELCFCILTANSTAESGIRSQRRIGTKGFLTLSEKQLAKELRKSKHRFPNVRAKFIVEARKHMKIKDAVMNAGSPQKARAWLVKNVKGIGWKEASHFLRNVGYLDLAILDRHVLRILREYGIIKEIPRHLSEKSYLEIEEKMKELANRMKMSLGELDLYLWCIKTGRILK
ncbi:MAG: N-glycosylase/DNA lyase [Candidatus Hadarchaeales archaeon]